jgi:hypothetical protein
MSLIDLIHKSKKTMIANANGANFAKDSIKNEPTVAKVANVAVANPKDIKKIRAWLSHIGELEDDHHIVIDKCRRDPETLNYYLARAMQFERDERRQKALKMLESSPIKQRVYTTDTVTDPDNVILTIAIRGVTTFDMLIPMSRYDPFLLMEMIDKETQ